MPTSLSFVVLEQAHDEVDIFFCGLVVVEYRGRYFAQVQKLSGIRHFWKIPVWVISQSIPIGAPR